MNANRSMVGLTGALCTLALSLALPFAGSIGRTPANLRAGTDGVALIGFGSFSPAAADPRRAALIGRSGLDDNFDTGTFRFTPSGANGARRAVTVAVRARGTSRNDAVRLATATTQIAPAAYNLGVAVGWKRFAVSGDVAKVQGSLMPDNRQSAEIGVSYSGNRWNTRVELGADSSIGDRPHLLGTDQSYSLGVGGSYALTRNLEVTGGLRYRTQRDRVDEFADTRRDSQAVYVGTAFRF